MNRLDISNTRRLFGDPATLYGPIIAGTMPRLTTVHYRFWDNESLLSAMNAGALGAADCNAITTTELLLSAHLAASSSIIRSARWFEATWREYEADNYLGWAACCRSLLEAIGDTIDGLLGVSLTIAEQIPMLMQGLTGFDEGLLSFGKLEEQLIHFSHGRRLEGDEKTTAPATHKAKSTTDYIKLLESAGGPSRLYSELCQIGHPARESLSWMYRETEEGFRIDPEQDAGAIAEVVARHKDGFYSLPSIAFNPGLLTLRVMVKFGLFPLLPELRDFSFQGAKGWEKIKSVLAKAPKTLRRHPLVDELVGATTANAGTIYVAR